MKITLLAAISENSVIGDKGGIPWDLPSDMKHFKEYTMGKVLLMGRNTFESLPTLLKGRTCIVVSSSLKPIQVKIEEYKQKHPEDEIPTVLHAHSLEEVFTSDWDDVAEIVVIGGSTIYKQMYDYADTMVITMVHTKCEGDTLFGPKVNWDHWNKESSSPIVKKKTKGDQFDSSLIVWNRIHSDNIFGINAKRKLTKTEQMRLMMGI